MIRSLYSGISGLRTHQVGLDVTANNIANVNTLAFKAGRATFKESMVQMLQGASRPAGNQGGRNPMQVGLGVAVGSIDTMLRQGNLQTTGQITDLALEGRAYFAFSSGDATYYSRNGGMQLDSDGHLVSPTNGWRLQGKMADADGTISSDALIGDLRIPWGEKAPAKATENIGFKCNLNSNSQALGTVTHTNSFLANAGVLNSLTGGDTMGSRAKLTDLFDANGKSLGIKEYDTLSFSVADDNVPKFNFKVEKYPLEDAAGNLILDAGGQPIMQMPTLDDLARNLEMYLNFVAQFDAPGGEKDMAVYQTGYSQPAVGTGVRVNLNSDTGGLNIINNSGAKINGLQTSSSRPGSKAFVANSFLFPRTIDDNASAGLANAASSYTTPTILIPATANDTLTSLFDADGKSLGFTNGDKIEINGSVGGRVKSVTFIYYDGSDPAHPATKMDELIQNIMDAFGLPPTDGTIYQRPSATLKDSSDLINDGIPLGAIVLRGQPELAFALTGLKVIGKQDDPNQKLNPARFTTNMNFTNVQNARNTGEWKASDIIFDDSGAPHNVVMKFTHTGTPGEWLWEMSLVGGEEVILGGNSGRITFIDGTPASFSFDDGSNQFRFDPRNGASEVTISLDPGEPGSNLGITQYESPNTTAISYQDGYAMGKLQEISIGENGEITGIYTNGISKAIAQIYVAEFNNPAGLMKMGDSMFSTSNNSGHATMYQPGVGSTTKIKPGALEMSNVELETEFTNMITIQRGYQASARVVSTSDQMLQELVQLVR